MIGGMRISGGQQPQPSPMASKHASCDLAERQARILAFARFRPLAINTRRNESQLGRSVASIRCIRGAAVSFVTQKQTRTVVCCLNYTTELR